MAFLESRIRPYQPGDLDDLYRICLLTSGGGQDGTSSYPGCPKLPGHVYAAPYGLFEPSLAFVAEDDEGVGGYVVGALDTQAFADRLERDWWPALRQRYPEPPPEAAGQPWTWPQRTAYSIHHPWSAPEELTRAYPSHLHINLVPRLQGRGHGRQMIERLLAALRARGSRGVHLFVGHGNERAPGFYRQVGFTELPTADIHIFTMDLRGTR